MTSYIDNFMRAQMAKHQLEEVDAGSVPMFWLREPGVGHYRLLVTDLPGVGVTLVGDLTIGTGPGGAVVAYGYNLDWFTSKLDEGYLCEKFLREEWSIEAAELDIKQRIRDCRADDHRGFGNPGEARKWVQVARAIRGGDIWGQEGLRDALHDAGFDLGCDYWPGEGYRRASAGWLCAAQQRFRELWLARAEEAA